MKLKLVSDVHFEFHADGGKSFVESLDPSGCDALVVAGDLCTVSRGLMNGLSMLCRRFPEVVFVEGNHEHYGSERGRVRATLRLSAERHPNLRVLDCGVIELAGGRILGAPLWFPDTPLARQLAPDWSDFQCAKKLSSWVYRENARAVEFLRRELREGDAVVTHHLPSWRSVHPRYAREPSNCFFVCDLEPLIAERRPAVWMHGHTHESMDYRIGPTRVVCNPFGYAGRDLNPRFRDDLVVEA